MTVLSANRTVDDAGRALHELEICVAHYCKTLCKGSLSPFESNAEPLLSNVILEWGKAIFQLCAFVVEEEKVNFYNNNQCVIMYNKQQHNEKKYNVPTITYK